MKKILVIAGSILVGTMGAYAQGTLFWEDSQGGTYLISILSPDTATPFIEQTGQTAYDEPVGNTSYTGGYIGGATSGNGPGIGPTPSSGALGIDYQDAANFTAGLYIDSTLNALTIDILNGTPAATTTLLGGVNYSGLYNPSVRPYVSGLAIGTKVFVGIAAWYNGNGANSFASSMADKGAEGFVESSTSVALGGGQFVPGSLSGLGLTSFSLATPLPEPSTVALGLLGASAVLVRMRRNK